jgi:hypothetical protein
MVTVFPHIYRGKKKALYEKKKGKKGKKKKKMVRKKEKAMIDRMLVNSIQNLQA